MTIGIIKEGKTPPDKRVPFTPEQCKQISARYPDVNLVVQRSPIRAFTDEEYAEAGIELVDNLNEADIIFGVKEVRLDDLYPNKTYFFFSHTIKEQPYNRELLQTVLERNIRLIDYETLTAKEGGRLVGFGKYAGIVGCYNAFRALGERNEQFSLKPAYQCLDRKEMEEQLSKIELTDNFKIVITGLGRVASGAKEILTRIGIKEVEPAAFLSNQFEEAVYTQLSVEDYFKKPNGSEFERSEVFEFPERFESDFFKYSQIADMYISCHFWDSRGPKIFSKSDMQSDGFNIDVIADISCDIDDPIPSTIRPSTISNPIYEYDRLQLKEVEEASENTITVMAVDNLPCELPKDASEDFGDELLENILPNLLGADNERVIDRATIAQDGDLTSDFEYLRSYVEGE